MSEYWEDRLTAEQYAEVLAAQRKFDKSKRNFNDKNIYYEELVYAGLHDEEAAAFLDLEEEDE